MSYSPSAPSQDARWKIAHSELRFWEAACASKDSNDSSQDEPTLQFILFVQQGPGFNVTASGFGCFLPSGSSNDSCWYSHFKGLDILYNIHFMLYTTVITRQYVTKLGYITYSKGRSDLTCNIWIQSPHFPCDSINRNDFHFLGKTRYACLSLIAGAAVLAILERGEQALASGPWCCNRSTADKTTPQWWLLSRRL